MTLSYSAPPHELAIELSEVRADAAALAEIFSQLNAPLPKDFPREAILELAGALRELPDGTARGCLRPLSEAQSQLGTIRSQHIRHDDHQGDDWEAERPPLFRGEPLDQRFRGLMSSVSTALQTANRLASEEPEPEEPEASTEPPEDRTTTELIERSALTQQELLSEKQELNSLRLNSEPADNLGRRFTDALILNQLTRGELRLPRIVSARLRRIASALREYPILLQKAAELVSAGTHIADYAHEKWSALETRIFQAGTNTIREIADDISSYARKLDASRRMHDAGPQKLPQDFNLEEATRLIHAGNPPPAHWRSLIESLPLKSRRLKSLTPLAGLSNLRDLTRVSVKVWDISVLSDLTSLEHLDLSYTQIEDLKPLSRLTKLKRLSLIGTRISDLSPLAELRSLEYLDIDRTNVTDLTPLRNLRALKALDFRRTKISSLSIVDELENLQRLYLNDTPIKDLSALCPKSVPSIWPERKFEILMFYRA